MESKKLFKWNQNYTVLLLSIGISFFVWLMLKMSTAHTFTQTISINYQVPESMTWNYLPVNSLDVLLRGEGWDLIKSTLNKKSLEIDIELSIDTSQTITESTLQDILRKNLQDNNIQIMNINPSRITLGLTPTYQKKVPIELVSDISFYPDHDFSKEISVEPDSVVLFGPQELLDSIQFWSTENLELSNLKQPVSKTLKLISPQNELIKLSTYSVLIEIEVEEFTEKVIELPIQLVSKTGKTINDYQALPESARVYAIIPLSMYELPSTDEFKLVAEIDESKMRTTNNKVSLKLALYPGYVKTFKIHPNTVDVYKMD